MSESDWNRVTDDYQGYASSNEGAFSDGGQHRATVRKARVKRKVARKERSSSSSFEKLSDEGAVRGVVDRDQSDTERNQNKDKQTMAQPGPGGGDGHHHQRGPNIRLPWFNGKEEEQVEKYFRELKRLKAIYDWSDAHLLNMALLGLKGRADDWAGALVDNKKDTFEKLETQMIKIFGDRRAKWQKHAEFCGLRQGKDQSVIKFAGVLKQIQIKSEASDSMMLAVFLEGLKQSVARQMAILNPNTFTEAVDCHTRLESLDKAKGGPRVSNAVSELGGGQEDNAPSALDSVAERFGVVLARLEAAPWFQKPKMGQGESAKNNSGYRQQNYEKKTG